MILHGQLPLHGEIVKDNLSDLAPSAADKGTMNTRSPLPFVS